MRFEKFHTKGLLDPGGRPPRGGGGARTFVCPFPTSPPPPTLVGMIVELAPPQPGKISSTFFCPTVLTQVARAEAEAKGDERGTLDFVNKIADAKAHEAHNINTFNELKRRNSELERQNSELKRQKSELKRQKSELERQNIEVKNFMARYKGGS